MVEQVAGMTLDDFIRLYAEDGPFELVDGEKLAVSPTVAGHGTVIINLLKALLRFDPQEKMGVVRTEQAYVLTYESNWVKGSRVPDVMFFAKERIEAYMMSDPNWREKPYVLVPDLVVEIISPTDQYTNVVVKANRYLNDGVKLVWVVDPSAQIVTVYHEGSAQQTQLTADDALEGGDLLPGFTLPLRELFA